MWGPFICGVLTTNIHRCNISQFLSMKVSSHRHTACNNDGSNGSWGWFDSSLTELPPRRARFKSYVRPIFIGDCQEVLNLSTYPILS